MGLGDLEAMAGLLGDAAVMRYYPAPKSRADALRWIEWNLENYARHGHGLWIVETAAGEFVGDCGLTWQHVNGEPALEVGYHLLPAHQGLGYATEAAAACRDFARDELGASALVAIIHPENAPSRRVAERIGLTPVAVDAAGTPAERVVLGVSF
jgi:RimJ/RimL family protein N-acetyltransferase